MPKIVIDATKNLTSGEILSLKNILSDMKTRLKNKNSKHIEIYWELKWGTSITDWYKNLVNQDDFYSDIIKPIQNELLYGYKKIIEPLVKDGLLIASNAGTQLGIVRENKLIPWDDDIDLVADVIEFNKNKKKIDKAAKKHGWVRRERNWIKNNLKLKWPSWLLINRLRSKNNLIYSFADFEISFRPSIDIFPAIRVGKDISDKRKCELGLNTYGFYKKNHIDFINLLVNNEKLVNAFPDYIDDVKIHNPRTMSFAKKELEKTIKKLRDENGDSLLQIHIAIPQYATFVYEKKDIKKITYGEEDYDFIVSDNHIEQFEREYGQNWNTPIKGHLHFIDINKVKINI